MQMKMRQAAKIVKHLAEHSLRRYRPQTVARARAVWDHHEIRHAKRFVGELRRQLGPLGFFQFRVDIGLRVLEDKYRPEWGNGGE